MKLVDRMDIKEGKFYLFYRTVERSDSKYCLLIEGVAYNSYKSHGGIYDTFKLSNETMSHGNHLLANDSYLYELSDHEFNKHIVIDNL